MASFNEEFQEIILPVVVVFIICNIVGFFGNLSVLYVYGFHYPKNRFRYLVLAICLVDFSSCCTTVPMETVSTWYWFDTPSVVLCKAKNFFVQLIGLSAMYMLFVTAVCKYRQICKPFQGQVSKKWIVILCVCGVFGSFLCAIPAAILWDINNHTVPLNDVNETVKICEVREDYHNSIYPALYRHLLSAYDVFLLATIILYVFVARATLVHVRRMKKLRKSTEEISMSRQCSYTRGSECIHTTDQVYPSLGNVNMQTNVTYVCNTLLENHTRIGTVASNTRSNTIRRSVTQTRTIPTRKVLIMVIIAGTFSVTFLMALTFGYVFALRNYDDYHSLAEIIILFCCYRFYFINYALNPIVYFILDISFRKEILKIFIQ